MTNNTLCLVFIKSGYVRDMQAFVGIDLDIEEVDIFAKENDKGWRDCEGSVLVAVYPNVSEEEALQKIKQVYPDASDHAFAFHIMYPKPEYIKDATFTTVWDDGASVISTACKVNTETKEVFDIIQADGGYVSHLDMQYVSFGGNDYIVAQKDEMVSENQFWYN